MYKRMKVSDINDRDDLMFLSDSQDIERIKQDYTELDSFDSCFVKSIEGEIVELYVMCGIVPFLTNSIYRIL